jgi:hypothetical protein
MFKIPKVQKIPLKVIGVQSQSSQSNIKIKHQKIFEVGTNLEPPWHNTNEISRFGTQRRDVPPFQSH